MDKPQIPLFGPISEHEDVSKFDTISKRTILLPSASFEEEKQDFSFSKHILFRFFILSQRTSYSTQLLVSWGLIIPAIALNRVRLEQLIVSSYLIHEDADKGINPFVKHMPIANFENIKAAWSDAKVAEILKQDINIDGLEKEAANAISDFSIEFKFSPEKTKKKWTSLDLRSMAKRRDLLTKSLNRISEISLERFYITIYKDLSSVIHCNSLALSPSFLGKPAHLIFEK